jgi:hypothetical protein
VTLWPVALHAVECPALERLVARRGFLYDGRFANDKLAAVNQNYTAVLLPVAAAGRDRFHTTGVQSGNDLVNAPINAAHFAVDRQARLASVGGR